MGTTPKAKAKGDTYDALGKTLTGVLVGIKANMPNTKSITLKGTSTLMATLTGDFQSFVDQNTTVDGAKATLAQEVTERKQQRVTVKQELTDFTTYAVMQFGTAAYAMFGLTPPKPKTKSATKTAIAVQKRQAKALAKAAALATLAPKQETLVALDADGNPIIPTASAAPAPSANPAPAAPAATPAPGAVGH